MTDFQDARFHDVLIVCAEFIVAMRTMRWFVAAATVLFSRSHGHHPHRRAEEPQRRIAIANVAIAVFVAGGALALARQNRPRRRWRARRPGSTSSAAVRCASRSTDRACSHRKTGGSPPAPTAARRARPRPSRNRGHRRHGIDVIQNPELEQAATAARLELRAAEAELQNRRNGSSVPSRRKRCSRPCAPITTTREPAPWPTPIWPQPASSLP